MTQQKDEFHIILPSNNSMIYFPENTTTRFVKQLSHPLKLPGKWKVSLEEISIPMNFFNVPAKYAYVSFSLIHAVDILEFVEENVADTYNFDKAENCESLIPAGVYQTFNHLIDELNKLNIINEHIKWMVNPGGYVETTMICDDSCGGIHLLQLSPYLQQVLGFPAKNRPQLLAHLQSTRPTSIFASLPCSLFVYTDIYENYMTGDVQTALLRIVPLYMHNYAYGSTKIKSFSTMRYIPLLKTDIRTIGIDIRDDLVNLYRLNTVR